jgi:transposase InsO family protein
LIPSAIGSDPLAWNRGKRPLVDLNTFVRVLKLPGDTIYMDHELTYGSELITCGTAAIGASRRTDQGWLYLAGVIDLCSRKIVGWSMADHLQTELVRDALKMAIARRCPGQGLLHHSDRGVQYASDDYTHLLLSHGMTMTMSGKGDCWDNAAMESFWATLKTELVHHEHYATHEQARASIFEQ